MSNIYTQLCFLAWTLGTQLHVMCIKQTTTLLIYSQDYPHLFIRYIANLWQSMYIIYYSKCSQISPLCSLENYEHLHIQETPINLHACMMLDQTSCDSNSEKYGVYITRLLQEHCQLLGKPNMEYTHSNIHRTQSHEARHFSWLPNSMKLCKNLAQWK